MFAKVGPLCVSRLTPCVCGPSQEGSGGLTTAMLAAAPPEQQKQMLGERLFPLVQRLQPELAGKITGEPRSYCGGLAHPPLTSSLLIDISRCRHWQNSGHFRLLKAPFLGPV